MRTALQCLTSSNTGMAVPATSFSEGWPRLSQEFAGLSMSTNEPQLPHNTDDTPQDMGPKESEHGGSQEGPSPQSPQEYPTCHKPDPAVLWMDRTAAALRVLKEAIVLTGILLPWILGARVVDAALALFAPPDSPTAG
jgi:hypothetical protein